MNREAISALAEKIRYHRKRYYDGNPEILDHEFDALEEELRRVDPDNEALHEVGAQSTGKRVAHERPMLSLEKTYVVDDLVKWAAQRPLLATFKVDGTSGSLLYTKGRLSLGKTRGDGRFGELITEKVKLAKGVVAELESSENVEIRGEIYITEQDFIALGQEMRSLGLGPPQSIRNIVAGLVGRKDHTQLCRFLSFQAFEWIDEDQSLHQSEYMRHLEKQGFKTPVWKTLENTAEIEEFLDQTQNFMADGDYLIDGAVFSLDDTSLFSELGQTAHHPRYKMAFKFKGDAKQTEIESIEWSISRNGIFTPVAIVKPVTLSGASISRVTLHNYGLVKELGLAPGATIEIIRSGEVIPKLERVVRPAPKKPEYPEECRYCHSTLEEREIRLYCPNEDCPGRQRESIINYLKKMRIEDLSNKRVEQMMEAGILSGISDLYRLKPHQLLELDKVKEKLANKILSNIEASKNVDLVVFLSALGITGGAYNKCLKVAQSGYDSIEKVMELTFDQLVDVDSFAEKSAKDFLDSLESKHKMIEDLQSLGLLIRPFAANAVAGKLDGKVFVITGKLNRPRKEIKKAIEMAGGKVGSSVSSNTDFLVTNDPSSNSSKAVAARDLGLPIITEETLFEEYV